jgi:hypothetical protein
MQRRTLSVSQVRKGFAKKFAQTHFPKISLLNTEFLFVALGEIARLHLAQARNGSAWWQDSARIDACKAKLGGVGRI